MKAIDRCFGPAHSRPDLARRQAHEVPQDDDVALILWQRTERLLEAPASVGIRIIGEDAGSEDLFKWDRPALPYMVNRGVTCDANDPRRKWDFAWLVPADHRHEPQKDLLRHILGFILVAHDAEHVAVDAVLVAKVEVANGVTVSCPGESHRVDDRWIVVVLLGIITYIETARWCRFRRA